MLCALFYIRYESVLSKEEERHATVSASRSFALSINHHLPGPASLFPGTSRKRALPKKDVYSASCLSKNDVEQTSNGPTSAHSAKICFRAIRLPAHINAQRSGPPPFCKEDTVKKIKRVRKPYPRSARVHAGLFRHDAAARHRTMMPENVPGVISGKGRLLHGVGLLWNHSD